MRRPAGVILAGILLSILALCGILTALTGLVASVFVHNPAIPQMPGVRAIMIGTSMLEVGFFIFCGWTAIGLFRLRPWSRIAALAIAGLVAFFSGVTGLGLLLGRHLTAPPVPAADSGSVQAVLTGISLFCLLVVLISIWWLVYFNLAPVRRVFAGLPAVASGAGPMEAIGAPAISPQPGTPGWRIVIMVWAWLMLVCMLFLPIALLRHLPIFLLGATMTGSAGTAAILILAAAEIYLAIGLLRKWKPAWYLALFFQIYTFGYFLSFLIPGVWARFQAYDKAVMRQWGVPTASPYGMVNPESFLRPGLIMGVPVGLVLVAVFTWALIQRRQDYLGA